MKTNVGRRRFLKSLSASALGLSGLVCQTASARGGRPPARKPNIVMILIDDLGWGDVGCYGHQFHETPNVDRLARQGMRFTAAYAACPVCSPTRASIISGQYPAHVGITDFIPGHQRPYEKLEVPVNRTQYLPLEAVSIAEALKPAGYVSGAFGKWHLGDGKYNPDKQGFDEMLVTGGRHFAPNFRTTPKTEIEDGAYLGDVLTARAEKFMADHRERPFFLYLSHYAVHIPLEAKQELIAKYEKKPKPPTGVNNPIYAAMVEHIDQSVGRVLKKIDELGLAADTIVIFFSDNGGLRQRFDKKDNVIVSTNAPLRDEKGSLYEGGVREPLIVRWPGAVEPGSECAAPVTSVDFYPTFLDIAGAKRAQGHALDGESLLPLLRQTGGLQRDAIFWHYPHYHHSTPAGAIRQGDWKLLEFFEDGKLELYNLKEDLSEKINLAQTQPEKARALQKRLAAWRRSVNAPMPRPNPNHDPARAHEWGKMIWSREGKN